MRGLGLQSNYDWVCSQIMKYVFRGRSALSWLDLRYFFVLSYFLNIIFVSGMISVLI